MTFDQAKQSPTGILILWLGLMINPAHGQQGQQDTLKFSVPANIDYDWIASRIYRNEANNDARYLTYWGEGEDFPSFGIGHFIWFPEGIDAPFDESFPSMFAFVRNQVRSDQLPPAWLSDLFPFDAPWNSKKTFDEALGGKRLTSLRNWLESTANLQARFIVTSFENRWRALDVSPQKDALTAVLQQLVTTGAGLYAVIDYYNFKGLGVNRRERYAGEGWGLIQVLQEMRPVAITDASDADVITEFRRAAAARLQLRVQLSPPERNEERWLDGWLKRLETYQVDNQSSVFRVRPYLQNPGEQSITLMWFSQKPGAAVLEYWKLEPHSKDERRRVDSSPEATSALAYHTEEIVSASVAANHAVAYKHEVNLAELAPGTRYAYRVTQNGESAIGSFRTSTSSGQSIRFIVYADSETEPESTGKFASWPGTDAGMKDRKYPVDQTTGYVQNLKVINERSPDFIAIAGDLVQSGGEQRDWEEFWSHNAGIAASIPIVPALGNHEYFGGPGNLGRYGTVDSERAVAKFKTYFEVPGNNARDNEKAERYYALHYGPVTLIVLDGTDGLPHQSVRDANWRLLGEGEGGVAPDWHKESEQYRWLENELTIAQADGQILFVMFHGSPYTSGVHGQPPGEGRGKDILSAKPLQALTPLFMRHGVAAVFGGHDEMYEHSVITGEKTQADGISVKHELHFFDIGIGGDGLRGPKEGVSNPNRVFLAHEDAPETYNASGILESGGKHYGHLEINVGKTASGLWQAVLDPIYIFPVMNDDGQILRFERRLYDDSVTLDLHRAGMIH